MGTSCVSVDSECDGNDVTEVACVAPPGVCKYRREKMDHVATRLSQVEAQLADTPCSATDIPCVLEPDELSTSAKLRGLLGDETGTGAAVFGDTPTLTTPIIAGMTVAALPIAGTLGRWAVVTDGDGGCSPGGGSDVCLCYDTGSTWTTIACGEGAVLAHEPTCLPIRNPTAVHDNLPHLAVNPLGTARTLVGAFCRCVGVCTVPPTFVFAESSGNAIGLTGGEPLDCATGTGLMAVKTFSTGDGDRVLAAGEHLLVSVANTPGITDGDAVSVCVY
jgi:hypothetical protein